MKNCSVFASLISPSKMIFEVRQKYSAARRIFNSLLGVSSGDETLRLMFDILHQVFRKWQKLLAEILPQKSNRRYGMRDLLFCFIVLFLGIAI